MAKEFAIITKPTEVVAIGTLTAIGAKKSADNHKSHDANGNVDGQSFNREIHTMDFEVELDDRAAMLDIGDTISSDILTTPATDFVVTECEIKETNSGDPNTYTGTAEYDVPSA